MPRVTTVTGLALLALVALQSGASAQNLAFSLFERYVEPLRVQAGIPGISAIIVQDGQVVWERGFGHRDVEAVLPALPDTPYPIADLTQALSSTLLLQCAERGDLSLDEPIVKWVPGAVDAGASLQQLMAHAAPGVTRGYKYDPSRFALLGAPIAACTEQPYAKALAVELLDRLVMSDAIPGREIHSTPAELRQLFDAAVLDRYARTLTRMATPYRVDKRGRAARSELPPAAFDAGHGLIASARDLAQFDQALDSNLLLRDSTQQIAWTNAATAGVALPTGLGWFVQNYEGERLVWHFGSAPDAYSSLMLRIPRRRLTLIMLANSDGLTAPFSLADGDVTSSLFARTFLRLFL